VIICAGDGKSVIVLSIQTFKFSKPKLPLQRMEDESFYRCKDIAIATPASSLTYVLFFSHPVSNASYRGERKKKKDENHTSVDTSVYKIEILSLLSQSAPKEY
jgi:hypothetical protein